MKKLELTITKETIKEGFNKIENIFKDKTVNWKPKHWFIAGAAVFVAINLAFDVLLVVTLAITWVFIIFIYLSGLIFGMDKETVITLLQLMNEDSINDPLTFEFLLSHGTDYILAMFSWLGETGRKAWELLIDYFPVLLDFNLDLDFINIDIVKILRSVFSILQFIIIFILMRKFRIWLRKTIKKRINDFDSFDKQFFQEVRM